MQQKTNFIAILIIITTILVVSSVTTVQALDLGQRTLKFGHVGSDVVQLQSKLQHSGYYYYSVDGIYGKMTERAVIHFQQANNLRIDGLAGYDTIDKLKNITNKSNDNLYYVQRGDTLSKIAHKFNVSINELKLWNNINSNYIYVGQKIEIKKSTSKVAIHSLSKEDFNLLTRAVYSEARGESLEGQVAVASVILNRIEDNRFPNTVKGVVFQPWAFTAVHDGQFWLTPNTDAQRAVKLALKGWDPTFGATFYYNPAKVTSHWIYTRQVVTRIGRHYFAS
ncbi:spore cortex-lytic enzyme [Halanaerobacter jeridensis]|uniref:Spore cortex-lytic enzyme n=1 Tax=Halanaerobacter jeridensis TaxID=706427 RepID=A0A938XRD7_9FIRM|nr:spore cortex-lytic enzyme [Halanaerobacter jeridensis]MBM7555394.1 N-acetylmuramoyl-L-alanine amidase [Halanaerobacter jeridensis]